MSFGEKYENSENVKENGRQGKEKKEMENKRVK
jgi:hypothetical protein